MRHVAPLFTGAALLILLGVIALGAGPASASHTLASKTITVDGDAALLDQAAQRHWPGTGTADDPYRIENIVLGSANGTALSLKGTTKHVLVRAVTISSGSSLADGIRITDASNITVSDSTIESSHIGIQLLRAHGTIILRNTVKSSSVGIALESTSAADIRDNRLSVNDVDVDLVMSAGNVFRNNNLSIATGQLGFAFRDTASYANRIDPTNVVNFVPMRWYFGAAGTRDSPLVVSDIAVGLHGITNVAQVALINVSQLVVERVSAKDGRGQGILVLGSNNVTIHDATVEGNAREGLRVGDSTSVFIRGGSLRGNGVGLDAKNIDLLRVDDILIERNAKEGVIIVDAQPSTFVGLRALGNGADGVKVSASYAPLIQDSTLSGNGGAGLALDGAPLAQVRDNTIERNLGPGIRLTRVDGANITGNAIHDHAQGIHLASSGAAFHKNEIRLGSRGFGFFFANEASYANAIPPTNTVNGVAMRWYTGAMEGGLGAPPAVLSDVRVDLRGITNVAQMMLSDADGVALERVVVENGTADGLLLLRARNITLTNATARGNTDDGFSVRDGHNVRFETPRASDNGGAGFAVEDTRGLAIAGGLSTRNAREGTGLLRTTEIDVRRSEFVSNGGAGLVVRTSPGAQAVVEATGFRANAGGGLLFQDASVASVAQNAFARNGPVGLELTDVTDGARVTANKFQNHTRAVALSRTAGHVFRENLVSARGEQLGFSFGDAVTYDNDVDQTNLFNAAPLRWYTRLRGTADAPIVLDDMTVTFPGSTNLAQVMLYNSSHVVMSNVLVARGAQHGVVIMSSQNVTLQHARAGDNGADGVHVKASDDIALVDVQTRTNAGDGVEFDGVARGHLTHVTTDDNRGLGVRATRSAVNMTNGSASRNALGGLAITDAAGARQSLDDVTAVANGGPGAEFIGVSLERIVASAFTDNAGLGVRITKSAAFPGHIDDTRFARNVGGGLTVESGGVERLARATFDGNGKAGLHLAGLRGALQVIGSEWSNHTRAIQLQDTRGTRFSQSDITIGARQTGFFFEDDSYQNLIDTTNTVNDRPVQWYTNLSDVRLPDVRADLPGITNVAQIMVYGSENVTFERPVAQDGLGEGIMLHDSRGVTLVDANVTGNRGAGLLMTGGRENAVRGGTFSGNGADGVALASTVAARVENATASVNRGAGLRTSSPTTDALHIAGNRIVGNREGGIHLEDAKGSVIIGNHLVGNGAAGIALVRAGPGTRVEENSLSDHGRGILLDATRAAAILANDITILDGQVGLFFADEESYENTIPVSNRVNGVAVQWHTLLSGSESAPVDLAGVRVDLRGITNVAQVMLYRSAYVTLPSPVAEGGLARGIYLYRSSSIALENASVRGNDIGVELRATQSSSILDADASGSRLGVVITESGTNVVARTRTQQAERGIVLDASSRGNHVFGTVATAVKMRAVDDPSVDGVRGANLVVDAGKDIRTGVGRAVRFAEAIAASRFESERIVLQRWEFGDGASDERSTPVAFRPSHLYGGAGTYTATLRVRTADGATYEDTANVRVVGPITQPTALRAVQGGASVHLTWLPPTSDGGADITGYRIYRGTQPENGTLIAELANVTLHLDALPTDDGVSYHYAVAAVNEDGEGPRSSWSAATPGDAPDAPASLTAIPGSGNVTLAWQPPLEDGGLPVTGYEIYRSAAQDEESELPILAAVDAITRLDDIAVLDGTTYHYEVAALNALGPGPRSPRATATPTPLPVAPPDLRALAGDRSVTLVWRDSPTFTDAPVLHYRVYRIDADGRSTLIAQVSSSTRHRDEGLSNAAEYTYQVSAVTRTGEGARTSRVTAAPQPIDDIPPIVLDVAPADGNLTDEVRPTLGASYVDNGRTLNATLVLDGREVARAEGITVGISHRPGEGLQVGPHRVLLRLRDAAGLETEAEWSFRLLSPEDSLPHIAWSNLTMDGAELALGDNITVTARAANVGFLRAQTDAVLTENGRLVATQPVDIPAGEAINVTFLYHPTATGDFLVSIGDAQALPLQVISLEEEGIGTTRPRGANDTPPAEDDGFLGVPAPPIGFVLLLASVIACARRRRT